MSWPGRAGLLQSRITRASRRRTWRECSRPQSKVLPARRSAGASPGRRQPSRALPLGSEQAGLMLRHQRLDDLAQCLALDDLRQLVKSEIDAVIAHAPLGKIIGAN